MSRAYDINRFSVVVGQAVVPSGARRPFKYDPAAGMRDIPIVPGVLAHALAVSDSGVIVGGFDQSGTRHGYSYDGTTFIDVGNISGDMTHAWVTPRDVNLSGDVVGDDRSGTTDTLGPPRAFLRTGGSMQDLGGLPQYDRFQCEAHGINDLLAVVGDCENSFGGPIAFVSAGAGNQPLLPLPGYGNSEAYAINAKGDVAGNSTSPGIGRAVVWTAAGVVDLGVLPGGTRSSAADLNDNGAVVGVSTTASGVDHGFVYTDGAMYDLNDLIPAGSGLEIIEANGINNAGEIVGVARLANGEQHAALLRASASVPLGHTFGSADAVNPTISRAEPVNTATGVYSTHVIDLQLSGAGVPFRLERSYVSADANAGALGVGWAHNLGARLLVNGSGDVTLLGEDGQIVEYTRQGDGTFTSSPGTRSTLRAIETRYELVRHDQVLYTFDTGGRLLSIRDRNGRGLAFTYGVGDEPEAVTDAAGRTANFTYANGLLTRVTLADGRHVEYGYGGGLLTSVVDVRGATTTYTYDESARLKRIIDQNNHTVVENVYSTAGRVVEQFDGRGGKSTFGWNEATQMATFTDPRGKSWTDVYQDNVLQKTVDPYGKATSYTYDARLNLASVTNPRGNTTRMTYDDAANLLTRTAPTPLSYQEQYAYNTRNDVTSYKDGRGNTTTYGYDSAGNVETIAQPGAVVTRFVRDPITGQIVSIVNARGKTTQLGYDTHGNLVSVRSPLGHETSMGYDASGRMTSLVDPRGNVAGANAADYTWTYTYNEADEVVTEQDPLGNTTTTAYDASGRLESLLDANGHKTTYGHDGANNLASVVAPDGSSTSYSYDLARNLIGRVDAKQRTTTYEYDDANRLVAIATPTGRRWAYSYDDAGNLSRTVDANGNATATAGDGTTTNAYDALNRLSRTDYSDGEVAGFEYNANDQRTNIGFGHGVDYTYDALDRVTQIARNTGAFLYRFSYAYDSAGNVVKRTYPANDNTVVDYTYDDDGRLASATSAGVTTTFFYDEADRLVRTTLPNGYGEIRTYDRAGRLTDIRSVKGTTTLSSSTYTLDPIGNPLAITGSAGTQTLKYDQLDRLTEVCFQLTCPAAGDPYIRYTYDLVGNRMSELRPTATTTYTYNAEDELVSRSGPTGTVSYGYDRNGNQTSVGARTFVYNVAGDLISTTSGRSTVNYDYDADGMRLQTAVGTRAVDITNHLWDLNNPIPLLAAEVDGSQATTRRYLNGPNVYAMVLPSSGAFYYHHDRLESITNLTSATGATQWTYTYEPFGATRSETKVASKAPANQLRFNGQQSDATTGLHYLRARYYDASVGRFNSADPLDSPVWQPYTNAYAYASNRPTALTDPTGLCPWCVAAVVGGLAGGGIYVGETLLTGDDFSWKELGAETVAGAASAGVGLGATRLIAKTAPYLSRALPPIGGAFAAGVAGTGGRALLCGTSPAQFTGSAAAGASSEYVAGKVFPQRGFPMRKIRRLVYFTPNAKRLVGASVFGGIAADALSGFVGVGGSCK